MQKVVRSYNLSASRFLPPSFLPSSLSAVSTRFYRLCLPLQTSGFFPQPCMLEVMTVVSAGADAMFDLGCLEALQTMLILILSL